MTPSGSDLKHLIKHHDLSQLWFQLAEIVEDRTYLRHGIEVGPGDVVIDAGANVGVAAGFFLAECGVAQVHSFEPVPAIHEMLVENMRQFPGASTYDFGLSDREAEVEFTYYENAAAMSSRYGRPGRDHEMVKAVLIKMGLSDEEAERRLEGDFKPELVRCRLRTLSSVIDEHSIERIDLLKIDVERAELDVLLGIEDRHWPIVRQAVAEVHDEDGRIERIRSMFVQRDFTVHVGQEDNMKGTDIFVLYASRT